MGGHGSDVQPTSGPAFAPDEAEAETPSGVARSGPSRGITGHQSEPLTLQELTDADKLKAHILTTYHGMQP